MNNTQRIAALTRALRHSLLVMEMVYDSSEDNPTNPIMQTIGRTLEEARRALDRTVTQEKQRA